MNSSIGGIDLTLETPRPGFDPRLILDLVLDHWPRAVFQDREGSTGRSLGEVQEGTSELTTNEFFVYQDEASARSWEQDGWTPENRNRMIHFLVRDSPSHADSLQLTMVVDDFTVEIADLYSALDGALGRPSTGTARPPRSATLEVALRAAGCSWTRTQFYDIIDDVRQAFYPGWSEDELACHPRDALQFCDAVRVKANAPVPDTVIMRAMLNRRKRKQP